MEKPRRDANLAMSGWRGGFEAPEPITCPDLTRDRYDHGRHPALRRTETLATIVGSDTLGPVLKRTCGHDPCREEHRSRYAPQSRPRIFPRMSRC
jgi:hypothetical protein